MIFNQKRNQENLAMYFLSKVVALIDVYGFKNKLWSIPKLFVAFTFLLGGAEQSFAVCAPGVGQATLYLSQSQLPTDPTNFETIGLLANPISYNTVGANGPDYNAMGFNTVDGKVYALGYVDHFIYTINPATGAATKVFATAVSGLPAALKFNAGDVDGSTNHLLVRVNTTSTIFYDINLINNTATLLNSPFAVNLADFAYSPTDGVFYGVDSNTSPSNLVRLSVSGSTVNVTVIGPTGLAQGAGIGATYVDCNGHFYGEGGGGAGSTVAYLYQFNLVTGKATRIANAPAASLNDGTSDPSLLLNISTDLGITKDDAKATFVPGTITTYTIVVTNHGQFGVAGAKVEDILPPGIPPSAMTYTTAVTGGAYSALVGSTTTAAYEAGSTTTALLDTVDMPYDPTASPPESTVTYTVTVNVPSNYKGPLNNTATVKIDPASGVIDTNPNNNSATDTDAPVYQADLAITKDDGILNVNPNGTTTYLVTVTNNGPSDSTAILTDPLVTGLTKNSVACGTTPGVCTATTFPSVSQLEAGGFVTPVIPSGSTYQIAVTAKVDATSGSVTNTANVLPPAGTIDPTPGNNTASDTDIITPNAHFSVTKDDGVTTVSPNGTTTYTITVTNHGPSASTAVIQDAVAAGLTKTAVACGGTPGVCTSATAPSVSQLEAGGFVTPVIASGGTYQIKVTAKVDATSGSVTNVVTVQPPPGTVDPTPGPDSTASDTDTVTPNAPQAHFSVVKDDGVTTVTPNGTTVYTITVTNHGPSASTAVIQDAVAAGLTKTAVACGGTPGVCTSATAPSVSQLEAGGFVTPVIASGGTYQIKVTAKVDATSGSVTNVVTVQPPPGTVDPTPGPDSTASDTDTVTPNAHFSVVKDDGVTTVSPNGTTVYTITVTNHGPSASTAVLVDPVATGLTKTLVGCGGTPGVCTASTYPSVGQLEAGGFVTPIIASGGTYQIKVTATVDATSGSVTNVVTVQPPPGTVDPTPGPDSTASDTDTVPPNAPRAHFSVTKDDGVTTVSPNGTTTYTITVTNHGPSASTALIQDAAAAGLTKTAVACGGTPGVCTSATAPSVSQLEAGGYVTPIIASGGTYQIKVTATVTAANGSVTNVVTVQPPPGTVDPTPGPDSTASDTDNITPQADLAITKDDGITIVSPNGTTTYIVTVTNKGPSASTATVKDPAVTGLTKTAVACGSTPGLCTAAPTVSALEAGFVTPIIPSGGTYQMAITATVTATSGSVTNIATVQPPPGTVDPVPGDNTASDTDNITPQADLAITKDDGITIVSPNGTTTYIVTVTNKGPSASTATVKDPAVTGLTKTAVACGSTPGLCTAAPTVSALEAGFVTPIIPSGGTYQMAITATVTATSGSVTNIATVQPPPGTVDPVPGDNTASDTDTVTPKADLGITKTDNLTTVLPNGTTTYIVTVTNKGPSASTATVTDPAVTGLTKTAVACGSTPGLCTAAPTVSALEAGFVTPIIPSGGTYQMAITATVTATSGSVTNIAIVQPPPGTVDPVPGDNTAKDTDDVTQPAMVVVKTGNKTIVELGDTILYTVNAKLNSGINLPEAKLVDNLPAGFRYVPGTATIIGSGTIADGKLADPLGSPGPQLSFDIGTLTATKNITVTYKVRAGVGAMQGDGINRVRGAATGGVTSNTAQYQVKVIGGVFANDACLVGKIFVDCNRNSIQDKEELGIPGVRFYLEDGTYFISDVEGKYSYCGISPRTHVVKVDDSTLPRGSRLTTTSNRNAGDANSLFLDVKNGELLRADFIEGGCSNTVLEQVKARRTQGEVRAPETEKKGEPALKLEGKAANYPQEGTDSANQVLVKVRDSAGFIPEVETVNNQPVNTLPDSSGNTRGKNLRDQRGGTYGQ